MVRPLPTSTPSAVPPASPNSYLIAAPISGAKTVCASGCDYTTLTGATGIFNAINTNVLTGNTDIQITGDLIVGEDGTRALNTLSEEPLGSNFTVRIYPTGGAWAVTGAFNGALVRMNGASRVTIDGSIGGVGTDRSLTITNTSVTSPSVVLFGSVGATPVTNDTLKNCVIVNGANTSSAVVISDATDSRERRPVLEHHHPEQRHPASLRRCVRDRRDDAAGRNESHLFPEHSEHERRQLDPAAGLYMQGVDGATVSQNTIGNFSNGEGESDLGIWLATGTANAIVSGNTVDNLGMTLTTAFAPFGIRESSGLAASGNSITGNTVTNLSTNGSTGFAELPSAAAG